MSNPANSAPKRLLLISLDTWAVFAATAFVVLILAGVLPRVPW